MMTISLIRVDFIVRLFSAARHTHADKHTYSLSPNTQAVQSKRVNSSLGSLLPHIYSQSLHDFLSPASDCNLRNIHFTSYHLQGQRFCVIC